MAQSRRWCFTLNNYTSYDETDFQSVDCVYMIYGKEHCPTTGTPHLQGYIVFSTNKRLASMKKLHPTAHWETAKGTTQQNIDYCSKSDPNPYLKGTPPMDKKKQAQDQKEKWADVIRSAKEGKVEDEYPREFIQYHSTLLKLHNPKLQDLDNYSGYWYVGPPDAGKSRSARANFPGFYLKMHNRWWDGYAGEDSVLIDDLSLDEKWFGTFLKQWCDHYPFRAEVKCSSIMLRPKNIIVTSNYDIEEIWADDPTLVLALKKRFKVVRFSSKFPVK